jgi:hypothetical protein
MMSSLETWLRMVSGPFGGGCCLEVVRACLIGCGFSVSGIAVMFDILHPFSVVGRIRMRNLSFFGRFS